MFDAYLNFYDPSYQYNFVGEQVCTVYLTHLYIISLTKLGIPIFWGDTDFKSIHFKLPYFLSQMGSYFGSSLACVDVNGDGFDDLIVGAPWYTSYEADIAADTG